MKLKMVDYNAGVLNREEVDLVTLEDVSNFVKAEGYSPIAYIDFDRKILFVTKHGQFSQR